MGCCGGDREKGVVSAKQKWSYLTLDDFRSKSCAAPFSYVWLWILVITAIVVLVADTFTCINLLAFDRWSSEVQPKIRFDISKWIFAICILVSFVLLMYEWIMAIRVIRRDGVAESYLNPLAAVLQSIRPGKGKGWRRFLVFAKLTKSKKGTDYIALFVYFQFGSFLRITLAEGPRQVINAITLYSVLQLNLLPTGKNAPKGDESSFIQFWKNIGVLYSHDWKQAAILCSMLFTLVIWVFEALFLIAALILYLLFLWHYIPNTDGTLTRYCRRKIEGRLAIIVSNATRKAIEKEEAKRKRTERKALNNGEVLVKPTLPDLDDKASMISTDTFSYRPTLPRSDTMTTVGTTPTLSRAPTLPDVTSIGGRPPPFRTTTQSSNGSYASNAPLMSNPGSMGYADEPSSFSPATASERDYFTSSPADYRPGPPPRTMTSSTQRSFGTGLPPKTGYFLTNVNPNPPPMRPATAQSRGAPTPGPGGLRRVDTSATVGSSLSRTGTTGPSPISPFNDPRSSPDVEPVGPSYEMNPVRTSPPGGISSTDYTQQPQLAVRNGPTPSHGYHMTQPPPRSIPERTPTAPPASGAPTDNIGSYVAFNPAMRAATTTPPADHEATKFSPSPADLPPRSNTVQPQQQQRRSFTSPMPRLGEAPTGRSATAAPGVGTRPRADRGFDGLA